MANFADHVSHAKHNLEFLSGINHSHNGYFDWQVTVSYYTALHLINSHIAKQSNMHFRTHYDTKNAINPFGSFVNTRLPENIYTSYIKLEILSRRARYLVKDKENAIPDEIAHITYDNHFTKAIRNLDIILSYFSRIYSITFTATPIYCVSLSEGTPLNNFKILQSLVPAN